MTSKKELLSSLPIIKQVDCRQSENWEDNLCQEVVSHAKLYQLLIEEKLLVFTPGKKRYW